MLVTGGAGFFCVFFSFFFGGGEGGLRGFRRSGRKDNKFPAVLIIVLPMPPRMFSVNSIFETGY